MRHAALVAWVKAASCFPPGSTVAMCGSPGNSCCGPTKASSSGCANALEPTLRKQRFSSAGPIRRYAMQRHDQLDEAERKRIQEKQGGHHYPPRPEDGPPMDDTDRNTDKVIKPSRRKP